MKKFSTSIYGYNKQEVNNFIENIAKEYESILNKLKAQDQEMENLKNNLVKYQNLETTLNKTILMAEDTSNQIKKLAREESKGIIDDAKRNASRLVNDALNRCEEIEKDAEALRYRVVNFKRKFKSAIENELEAIEDIEDKY